MGVFHCGVEVCGVEWSYGGERQQSHEWHPVFGESPIDSGVYRYKPKSSCFHNFAQSIDLGRTAKPTGLVLRHLRAMRHEWLADEYDALEHNCCHFSMEFCNRLGMEVPNKVLTIPQLGKALRDLILCKEDSPCALHWGEAKEDAPCGGLVCGVTEPKPKLPLDIMQDSKQRPASLPHVEVIRSARVP